MDRLEEANKVTSLMRRRENPRHISAARLMCNSAQERRGFFEAETGSPRRTEHPALRRYCAARRLAVSLAWRPVCGRHAPPHRRQPSSSRRADASRIRINGRGTAPLVPPRRQKLPVQISQAPLVSLRCDTPAPMRRAARFRNAAPAARFAFTWAAAIVRKALEPRPRARAAATAPVCAKSHLPLWKVMRCESRSASASAFRR